MKWSEIRKNQGTKTFLGLAPDEAALYSRAQFTPEEVGSLRTQFEQMDFVSPRSAPVTFVPETDM